VIRVVLVAALVAGCVEAPPSSPKTVAGGSAERGRSLIVDYGCGNCHNVPGVPGAKGRVGPPLDAFADRTFIAGSFRNEGETLVRWILSPQAMRPGTAMPTLGVKPQQARVIDAYLYTLHDGGLGPPHLIPQRVLPTH
jgi:cytochrome c